MNFGGALEAMKQGKSVRRKHQKGFCSFWLAKGMASAEEKRFVGDSLGIDGKYFDLGDDGIVMRFPSLNYTSELMSATIVGVHIAIDDLLAEDWCIVE